MSYTLYDSSGPLAEFASIGGYADFVTWAQSQEPRVLRTFVRDGFTEDLKELTDALVELDPPAEVREQVELLSEYADGAQDILIVSDGMSDEELRTATAKRTALHDAADLHVGKFQVVLKYAFAVGRKALGTPPNPERAARAVQKALEDVLPKTMLRCLADGGNVGLTTVQKLRTAELRDLDAKMKIRFNVSNPHAIDWAKKHAGELAKNLSATTLQDIKDAIAESLQTGESAYEDVLAAVGNADRAELIARHETMVAASEGQRQGWDQAVEKGLLTGDEERVWIIVDAAGLCKICDALDGQTAKLDGEYPDEGQDDLDGPPAHVACRCTEGIV